MAVAYNGARVNGVHVNGHDGGIRRPRSSITQQLDLELPESEPEQPKPCSLRLGYGSWCFLPDGHDGDHEGAPPQYGPIEERPVLWRKHKGQIG